MQPLSLAKRRVYFFSLIASFLIAVPLLIFYALGYRIENATTLKVIPTGGLYIATDTAGAEIFLNNAPVRETGAFRKAFYIQNLEPGAVNVRVAKSEYHAWEKALDVEAHIVTEATAFMLPIKPVLRPILSRTETITQSGTTTATTTLPNEEYYSVAALFGIATSSSTTTRPVARTNVQTLVPAPTARGGSTVFATTTLATTTATTSIDRRGVTLMATADGVMALWVRPSEEKPYYFCHLSDCVESIPLETYGLRVQHFDFFPGRGDIALVSREDGVYATEIDPRGGQNIQPLYPTVGADFRLGARSELFVRDGEKFFEVIL